MAEYNMPQYILREFKVTDARVSHMFEDNTILVTESSSSHWCSCLSPQDGQSRTVRQFQFTDWPEQGVPKSGEGFIDFIGQVHKTKEQFGQDGPIAVHCRCVSIILCGWPKKRARSFKNHLSVSLCLSAGVGRTGVFITLSIVLERMRYEGAVDIFQTVKMLRTQRPAMVQTEVQSRYIGTTAVLTALQ